jgi:hypothetical protein
MTRLSDRKRVNAAVEAELGGGKIICDTCGATLDSFAYVCTAPIAAPCPGFTAIDRVRTQALGHKP